MFTVVQMPMFPPFLDLFFNVAGEYPQRLTLPSDWEETGEMLLTHVPVEAVLELKEVLEQVAEMLADVIHHQRIEEAAAADGSKNAPLN